MISRFLVHIVFLLVFLFGNTFSCTAFTENIVEHGHEQEIIHSHESDDCCPKDGHKKQIESKSISQITQKQSYHSDRVLPEKGRVLGFQEIVSINPTSYYKSPQYDRQSLFFIDTIRLLL